jgi:hypothetical protein
MIMLTRRHLIALSAVQVFATNTFIREGRTQTPKVPAKLLALADEMIE